MPTLYRVSDSQINTLNRLTDGEEGKNENVTPGGVLFSGDLFQCQQDYEKTAGPIYMKFSGKVWTVEWPWDDLIKFWSIRINGSAGQRSICYHRP